MPYMLANEDFRQLQMKGLVDAPSRVFIPDGSRVKFEWSGGGDRIQVTAVMTLSELRRMDQLCNLHGVPKKDERARRWNQS